MSLNQINVNNSLVTKVDKTLNYGSNNLISSGVVKNNLIPLFEEDSDFSDYNGIRIYDITTEDVIPDDYDVRLLEMGKYQNNTVLIEFVKKGTSGQSGGDYLAQLLVDMSTISDDEEIQTLTIPPIQSGTFNYYVTLNIRDLKTINNKVFSNICLNKEYINTQFTSQYNQHLFPNIIKRNFQKFASQFVSLEFYIDDEVIDFNDNQFSLSSFIYNKSTNTFSCGIRRTATNGTPDMYYIDKSITIDPNSKEIITLTWGEKDEMLRHLYYDDNDVRHDDECQNVARFIITFDLEKYTGYNKYEIGTIPGPDIYVDSFSNLGLVTYANKKAELHRFYKQIDGTLSGDYVLSEPIMLQPNQKINGAECTVYCPYSNGYILLSENSSISGIKFYDEWEVPHTVNLQKESGIDPYYSMSDLETLPDNINALVHGGNNPLINVSVTNGNTACNASVKDCIFIGLNRAAIDLASERHRSYQHPYVTGCYFIGCRTAIYVHGEFIKISNCSIDNCLFGIVLSHGNSNIFGCILKRCDSAFYLYDRGNGLHGEFVSNQIAHCPLNGIYIKSGTINLGHLFIGLHIADAGIEGDVVNSMMFSGCRFESWFNFASGAKNSILNSIFTFAYANLYGKQPFVVPADTNMKNNRLMQYGGDDSLVNN